MNRWLTLFTLPTLFILVVAGCGSEPRFGSVTITEGAPNAQLTGVTRPLAPASDLGADCTGHLDPAQPNHEVYLQAEGKFAISARSEEGPVALLLRNGNVTHCDDDEGSGHVPYVQVTEPGRYRVYVASLESTETLAYTLAIGPDNKENHGATAGRLDVSVTVTSNPVGAAVIDEAGETVGTTPTLFVLPTGGENPNAAHVYRLELVGYLPASVSGVAGGGEMRLHADLAPAGPRNLEQSAATPQPIADMATVSQSVTIDEACVVNDIEVAVEIQHSYVADLTVTLRAPTGASAVLQRRRGGARANLSRTFAMDQTRGLRNLEAIQAEGEWTLEVADGVPEDSGTFESFTLRIECAAPPGSPLAQSPADRRRNQARTETPNRNMRPARAQRRRPNTQVLNPWGP